MATLSSALIDLLQMEGLKDEADPVGAQPRELGVGGAGEARGRRRGPRPLLGRSSVPMIVSIVVLPEPDGPTTATLLALQDLDVDPSSAVTPPGYSLVTSAS